FEHAATFHVIRIALRDENASGRQLLVSEERNPFDATAEIAPQLLDVARLRKSPGHADDGDAFRSGCRRAHAATSSGCFPANASRCLRARARTFSSDGFACGSLSEPASALTVGY